MNCSLLLGKKSTTFGTSETSQICSNESKPAKEGYEYQDPSSFYYSYPSYLLLAERGSHDLVPILIPLRGCQPIREDVAKEEV